jgi:glutathionyl-hydroquinone reductase
VALGFSVGLSVIHWLMAEHGWTFQEAYEAAVVPLLQTMGLLEEHLQHRCLLARKPIEADQRLFTAPVRFDPVASNETSVN